jgi:hypothetical protein
MTSFSEQMGFDPSVDDDISEAVNEANVVAHQKANADSREAQRINDKVNGGAWNDIKSGVTDHPLNTLAQPVGGVLDFGNEVWQALHLDDAAQYVDSLLPEGVKGVSDSLRGKKLEEGDVPFPENFAPPKTGTAGVLRVGSQFMAGFIPVLGQVSKGTKALGFFKNSKTMAAFFNASVAGFPVDALGFDPNDPNVANMVGQIFKDEAAGQLLEDYLGTDPNDSEALNRFKNGLNGLLIGGAFEGVFRGTKALAGKISAWVKDARLNGGIDKNLKKIDKLEKAADVPAIKQAEDAAAKIDSDNAAAGVKSETEIKLKPEDQAAKDIRLENDAAATQSGNQYTWKYKNGQKVAKEVGDYKAKKENKAPAVKVDKEKLRSASARVIKGDYESIVEKYGEALDTNIEKMATPDDVKAALVTIEKEIGPFAKDVTLTDDMLDRLAKAHNKTIDEVRVLAENTNNLPQQLLSADTFKLNLISDLVEVGQRAADSGNPTDIIEFHRLMDLFGEVDTIVVNAKTNIARSQAALRKVRGPEKVSNEAANLAREDALVNVLGGRRANKKFTARMLKLIDEAGSGPEALAKLQRATELAKKTRTQKTLDAFLEMYINGLLSKPVTQLVNFSGNISTIMMSVAERRIAQAFARGSAGVAKGETAAMINGLQRGIRDGFKLAAKAWRTGKSATDGFKSDMIRPGQRAIAGDALVPQALQDIPFLNSLVDGLGNVTRWPGKLLLSADEGFKSINYQMELHALSYRKAMKSGTKGADFDRIYQEGLQGTDKELTLASMDFAKYNTFTKELGNSKAGQIQKALGGDGAVGFMGRIFVPFFRTPVNILKFAAHRLPASNLISKQVQADIRAGGASAQLAYAKMAMGSAAMVSAMSFAHAGLITGAPPRDPATRRNVKGNGWRPYSVRTPWGYMPYNRFDPIGVLIGGAADLYQTGARIQEIAEQTDDFDETNWDEYGKAAQVGILSLYTQMKDRHYVAGLANIFDLLEAEPGAWKQAFGQQFKGMLPPFSFYSSFRKGVSQSIDPVIRDNTGVDAWEEGRNIILGDSVFFEPERNPKRDHLGNPQLRMGSDDSLAWRTSNQLINPAKLSNKTQSVLLNEISRLEISKSGSDQLRTISTGNSGDPHVPVTPDMKDFFSISYGKHNRRNAEKFVKTAKYRSLNPPRQKLELENRLSQAWTQALRDTRGKFRSELGTLTREARQDERELLRADDIQDRTVPLKTNPDLRTNFIDSLTQR